ncbi:MULTISPECIES: hypothetical protein [unclassified Streptomyces]|uniref:hypothetical protein n=1 Tax=unclassified Streptomyces TaxID=2593676 RepID=UPI00073CC690|nr:hypothetical protein [Streptomyces sp. AVP053U2]ODA69216.1 hypothetical protein APS67_006630 [Streptomyces sp. AVP053U2]
MTTTHNVYVPEGTFGVLDAGEIPVQTADWSNGLAVPMSQGALIVTGIHTGEIRSAATALAGPPASSVDASWEEIVEVSVHAPTGLLRVESLEQGPVEELEPLSPSGPGWYRLRVHARGRNVLPDKVSAEPVEDYLLVTWPAPQSDADIIRSSDRIDHAVAHAPSMPTPQQPAPARSAEQEALRRRLLRG